MAEALPQSDEDKAWESAHVCPNCEYVINLAVIDLRAITTGILSCPRCEWAGKIEIQIVNGERLARRKDQEE